VISGHTMRPPLLGMAAAEEAWLKERVERVHPGTAPRSKSELKPLPLQRHGDVAAILSGI